MGNTKFSFGFFLVILFACTNTTNHKTFEPNEEITVFTENNHFKFDTSAILSSINLPYLIHELENTNLEEKQSVADIPIAVKSFLDSLSGNFSIANPNENWQAGCTSMNKFVEKKVYNRRTKDTIIQWIFDNKPLPKRQLIYLGFTNNITLLTYKTGGLASAEHIIIVKSKNGKIIDFWCSYLDYDLAIKNQILNSIRKNKNSSKLRI